LSAIPNKFLFFIAKTPFAQREGSCVKLYNVSTKDVNIFVVNQSHIIFAR